MFDFENSGLGGFNECSLMGDYVFSGHKGAVGLSEWSHGPCLTQECGHHHSAQSFVWDQGCVDLHFGPKVLNRKAGGYFLGVSGKGLGSASTARSTISPGLVLAQYVTRISYFAFTFHLWIKSG
jgi:hypothetical protein